MKTFLTYECEKCGKRSTSAKEIEECEAEHLGLTVAEKNEFETLKEEVRLKSSIVNTWHNEQTMKEFDDAIEELMEFQRTHESAKYIL